MGFIIKNNKERVINLGTKDGSMLNFRPGEEKFVPEDVAQKFLNEIESYSTNGLITVVDKVKDVVQTNEFVQTENTVSDVPKKRTRKKKE